MFVQPTSVTPSTRQKNKAYATGIAAGVEDEKYQAKYKELKRKVKEIEMVCYSSPRGRSFSVISFRRTMTSSSSRCLWPKNPFNE
jgi:hypothetical protein